MQNKLIEIEQSIKACSTIVELINIFSSNILQNFGVTNGKISLASAKKLRQAANEKAIEIIEEIKLNPRKLTNEERQALSAYTGGGGLGEDTMNEYYTPQFVAQGIWDAVKAMGYTGGNMLEPSAGAGVFSGTKPPATEMTAVELDSTSGTINQLLNPTDTVYITNFEKLASQTEDESFDGVVGNPPFGDRDKYAKDDEEYLHITHAEKYFVERSIRLTKAGGLISMALPPRVIDRASWSDWRKELSYQAEFLGAQMLPAGTFNANGTGTTVIVAFWRKFGKTTTEQLENIDDETLIKANVLFDDYISGKYFERSGKKYVHGELEYKKGQYNRLETTAKGVIEPSAIQSRLSQPFHSRIDWELLALSQPLSEKYSDGDKRQINGRLKELNNGEWIETDTTGQKGNALDPKIYGVSSIDELTILADSQYLLTNVTITQAKSIQDNFAAVLNQRDREVLALVTSQNEKYQDQLLAGAAIGSLLENYRSIRAIGNDDPALRDEIVNKAQAQFSKYGHPHSTKFLVGLTGKHSSYWNDFCEILDSDGNPSAFLSGELDTDENQNYDSGNHTSVLNYLFTTIGNRQITIDDINEFSDTQTTLEDLIKDDSISIDANGFLLPTQQFTSGDVVDKKNQLISAIGKAMRTGKRKNAHLIDKWNAQLEAISEKRKGNWQQLTDIKVSLNAPWISKDLIVDYLKDNGYSEFRIGDRPQNIEDNKNGEIWGYRYDETGKKLSRPDEQFARHLENYINGIAVDGKGVQKAEILKDIKALNDDFADWIQSHPDSESIEEAYNDRYNRYIEFDYSGTDLKLDDVSGDITLMKYQNSAIRKLSEDGRGLLGFQMGLGKTFTALGLVATNLQSKKFKRTCITVPKSTYENWYHEHAAFFGKNTSYKTLFVGIEPVIENGEIVQKEILDKNGNGTGKFRDVVKELSSSEIAANMAKIPHSNYHMVVMTKEQFSRIPMRRQTKEMYVAKMIDNQNIRSTRIALDAILGVDSKKHAKDIDVSKGYAAAKKQAGYRKKYSNEGTKKAGAYPFYEDMLFDNIVADEAHNYRNSYQAGLEASKLAWLPTQGCAKTSLDMSLKLDHIRSNQNGKGAFLLTATPTVNSPTDIFNMLSLVIGADEWLEKYNIANVDDFIKVFGSTDIRDIEKLSGDIEPKDALIGFDNLKGLQSLFHRWCNVKDADDVGADVEIPNIETHTSESDLDEQQSDIYEELRQQAEEISKATTDEAKEDLRAAGITVFGIIRKMDKIATDPDLYHGTMTYHFNIDDESKVNDLVSRLPKSLKQSNDGDDKEVDLGDGEKADTFTVSHDAKVTTTTDKCILVVNAAYEDKVQSLLSKVGINEESISHPVTAKYAQLIENVKNGLKDGKQIIFTEEKTQHNKIKRILCHQLGIQPNQVGIINADAIKIAQGDNDELSGLEAIASDYNEGRKQIIIANKKAEVGINLHKGTTDIHHLTIPWTPASLRQRNGRGARVGSTAKMVRCWIYSAKGSFDKFRYQTMERKANWINEVLTTSNNKAENANADDMAFANDLLAKDEETRLRQQSERQGEADRKQKAEALKRATKQLEIYIKNGAIASLDHDELNRQSLSLEKEIDSQLELVDRYSNEKRKDTYKNAVIGLRVLKDKQRRIDRTISAIPGAKSKVKQLRPQVDRYIKNGTLKNIDQDVTDKPEDYFIFKDKVIKIGSTWLVKGSKIEADKNSKRVVSSLNRMNATDLIVRVAEHDYSLGYAKCHVLWPLELSVYEGYRGAKYLSGKDSDGTAIFYDSFIRPSNFSKPELDKENLINTIQASIGKTMDAKDDAGDDIRVTAKPISLDLANVMADNIGLEALQKTLKDNNGFIQVTNREEKYGNYGRYHVNVQADQIYYKDGEFSIEKADSLTFEMQPYLLIPAMLNDDLKTKLGRFILAELVKSNQLGSYRGNDSMPDTQLNSLLGNGWFNNIESFGDQIPKEDLCLLAENAIKECANFDWKAAAQNQYNYYMSNKRVSYGGGISTHNAGVDVEKEFRTKVSDIYYSHIDDKFMNKTDQKEVLQSAISSSSYYQRGEPLIKEIIAEVKAKKDAADKAKQDALQSMANDWKSGNTQQQAKERLDQLSVLFKQFNSNVDIANNAPFYQLTLDNDVVSNTDQLLLRVNIDLALFAGFTDLDIDNSLYSLNATNQYDRFERAIKQDEQPIVIDEPIKEEVEKKLSAPITDDEISTTGALADMILKLNKNEITVDERQVEKGKSRKIVTQKSQSFPAKSVIGIKDPDGYKGRLSQLFKGRSNPIKAKYNAEWFDRDDASELAGGWWLIPADTDLNELTKEFDNL